MPSSRVVAVPVQRSGLGLVQVCVGVLIGVLVSYALFDDPAPPDTPPAQDAGYPAVAPAGTIEVNVNAVLQLPTATVTTLPTATVPSAPTMDAHADDCNRVSPQAGDLCRQEPMPTNTAHPIPDCPTAPAELCVWRDPITSGNQENG